uniref:Uncharacterized protein n=1 Tax=Avena sativa TaxID=4498 RepID=A0ACD5Z4N3_AVESA
MSNAIMQGFKFEDTTKSEDQPPLATSIVRRASTLELSVQSNSNTAGDVVFCDAAWKSGPASQEAPAGIGVFIQTGGVQHCKHLFVSALSPPASTPLQAEAFGLLLATKLAEILQLRGPQFYMDCLVLASAVTTDDITKTPGHWSIRPLIADIQRRSSFQASNIFHLHRSCNVKAHHHARLALKIQSRNLVVRCLCASTGGQCPARDISVISVAPFTLRCVKCA